MNKRYITVTALTKYLKKKMDIDPHLQLVWLQGEISNFNHHQRGHMYLTIKDENARINAIMFAGDNRKLKFRPEDGMKVLIKGEVTIFESYGQYQIYIRDMEPDGIGTLYLAYEQLKETLANQGLFDAKFKKKLPSFPRHIGVITSPTGAAVRDIVSTLKRRYPIVQITIFPIAVQGVYAADSIKKAIIQANNHGGIDTLIISRGGGSIEDLWSFNEEKVVRAIFSSNIPVISGIGHETDTTISDFVADVRASTPTGAAELSVPSLTELRQSVNHLKSHVTKLTKITFIIKQEHLQTLQQSYAFHKPKQLLFTNEQHIDRLTDRVHSQFKAVYKQAYNKFTQQQYRLTVNHPSARLHQFLKNIKHLREMQMTLMNQKLVFKQQMLHGLVDRLMLLNPLHIMKRGFAIPYTMNNEIIKNHTQIEKNERIKIRISDGTLECIIDKIEGRDHSGR